MRRLLLRIGYTRLALIPAFAFAVAVALWFSLSPLMEPTRLLALSLTAAAVVSCLTLILLIVGLLSGTLHEELRATVTANVAAPLSLAASLNSSELPSLGGWSMDPDVAAALVRTVTRHEPHQVLELGPGASTELLLRVLPLEASLVSLEHDPAWKQLLQPRLQEGCKLDFELRYAPLVRTRVGKWTGHWYDPAALHDIQGVDLLIVDGPPGPNGAMARFPALSMVASRLADDALIFVDDASRPEEAKLVREWLKWPEISLADVGTNWRLLHWQRSSTESL